MKPKDLEILTDIAATVYGSIADNYTWRNASAAIKILGESHSHQFDGERVLCDPLARVLMRHINRIMPRVILKRVKVIGINSLETYYSPLLLNKRFFPENPFPCHFAVALEQPSTYILDPILLPQPTKIDDYLQQAYYNPEELKLTVMW